MLKQSLTTLFLSLCLCAGSCTDKSSSVANLGDVPPPPDATDNAPAVNPATGTQNANPPKPGPGKPPPEPVPEPMTMLLFGSGMAGLALSWRRRRRGGARQS